jgi:hypothetical protein
MNKMKYIRFRDLGVVIFDQKEDHKKVADKLNLAQRDKALSAGFVFILVLNSGVTVEAKGESVTLGISSMDGDAEHIRRRLFAL